jgi:hypothetical protein
MFVWKYLCIVEEDNTINDGGRHILVEITLQDFDTHAIMLDAVQCMLLFYQILHMSTHPSVLQGISISWCALLMES